MNDKERRASKYLPFDAVKGLKESLANEDQKVLVKTLPTLSDDQRMQMDSTLFECFSHNKAITISYFENGSFKNYSGIIQKIDVINKQIVLLPRKKFIIDNITEVVAKD